MTEHKEDDNFFMELAVKEAVRAFEVGEVPVGAVLVRDGIVLNRAHNLRESLNDPSAHAEVLALRAAAEISGSWRLEGATLYVTKEPCIMCAGTIVNSRITRLVYGCKDPKAGGVDSLYSILNDTRLNHRVEVLSGVREEECSDVLKRFFRERR